MHDAAAADYDFVKGTGLFRELGEKGWIARFRELEPREAPPEMAAAGAALHCVLEHERVPFVSYPYEWPFALLQRAALHHLDVHLRALEHGVTLSDASAYNVQFSGIAPVFIDVLSFRRYQSGEYWLGHRQFCENFLNPLLLRAELGLAHNAWFRGALEGIPTDELARLLPTAGMLLSWRKLTNLYLPVRLQRMASKRGDAMLESRGRRPALPLAALRGMLAGLRRWIAGLAPKRSDASAWTHYADVNTYSSAEQDAKRRFVAEFAAARRPRMLWDWGCNVGVFAETCLKSGAGYVVGFDADQTALDLGVRRAEAGRLAFLPLYMDGANPSPDHGWRGEERSSLARRAGADAILALAFEHHLAIARNIPLPELVAWLAGLAPAGVIEFVPKDDPTVRKMLALREDVFPGYGEAQFTQALSAAARIVRTLPVTGTGRTLYWYER